jgi:hypothetical protein
MGHELTMLKGVVSLLGTLQTNHPAMRVHCHIIQVKEKVFMCLKSITP